MHDVGRERERKKEKKKGGEERRAAATGQPAGVGKMANFANKLSRKLVGNKLEAGFVARVYSSGEKPSVHARVFSSFLLFFRLLFFYFILLSLSIFSRSLTGSFV